jgi:2-amino-4-hydroxy-6-hydroxymethyldihydropteridine diphosphokinase
MVAELHRGEKTTNAFLSLGSNLGDRMQNIKSAIDAISAIVGNIENESELIETEPWGMESNTWFINMVVEISTDLSPRELLSNILNIENKLGRTRTKTQGYEARTIDIDILFFGDLMLDEVDLIIPHPKLHERMFNLWPLAQLCPNYNHPKLNASILTLLSKCQDKTQIRPWR